MTAQTRTELAAVYNAKKKLDFGKHQLRVQSWPDRIAKHQSCVQYSPEYIGKHGCNMYLLLYSCKHYSSVVFSIYLTTWPRIRIVCSIYLTSWPNIRKVFTWARGQSSGIGLVHVQYLPECIQEVFSINLILFTVRKSLSIYLSKWPHITIVFSIYLSALANMRKVLFLHVNPVCVYICVL
jgi:hypothetical protein